MFTQVEKLADYLELDEEKRKHLLYSSHFPLQLPSRLASKIKKNSLDDPLLRQFVPLAAEKYDSDFPLDPVCDQTFRKCPKLLHKYEGRVLLVVTKSCAMHCRYCFRQNFSYETKPGYEKELSAIGADPAIKEVILSGGDPLSLSNSQLKELIAKLNAIGHLQRLRFHTRYPIGIPERIDDEFLNILSSSRLQSIFVIHSNHVNEWDDEIVSRLKKIQSLGIPILNQSVLLKGVNDSVEALKALSEKLISHGFIPYYLHQLDRVQGAAHFEVASSDGREMIEALQKQLSGYGVPKYVKEIAGEASKTPL